MVFITHTILHLRLFATAGARDKPVSGGSGYIHGFYGGGVTIRTEGKTGFYFIRLWYVLYLNRVQYSTWYKLVQYSTIP